MTRLTLPLALLLAASSLAHQAAADRPNIVYLLADDLGYGDVHALNPEGKIPTPHLDRLAAQGMAFTDAHSGSAVCTPTRYGILTGRYAWRSRLKSGVLGGYSRPLIEPGRLTIAAFLKQHGYTTACIGKWHLGLDWPLKSGGTADDADNYAKNYEDAWKVDYARPFQNGPLALGFDSFFGLAASLDMPPYLYLRDNHATEIPTTEKTWIRKGPASESFEAVDFLPALARESIAFLEKQVSDPTSGTPFFLYFPLTAPHTPIVPTPDWLGQSHLNAYADFTMQVDHTVGQVLEALDRLNLSDNTLVIFTSDNGCSPQARYDELLPKAHNPSYHFRGTKADIFEGGHRIPFLVRWPGHVAPGATSDQLTVLTDLFATCADILDAPLPESAAPDSVSMLPAFLGTATAPIREAAVHHSINGSFAIRQGPWKLALCPDSGGWSNPRPGTRAPENLPPIQLYNLETDISEQHNLQDKHPEVVARLQGLLDQYVREGFSR